jgi:hypothetical protein
MAEVSERVAVKRFAALMDGFIASPPGTAREIVDAVVEQFRAVRVKGVRDKLQFEWGDTSPHKLTRFADLRTEEFAGFERQRFQWVGVTRELPANEDDDDTALCAFLYFGPAGEDEPSGTIVSRLENLDARLEKFLSDGRVTELLAQRPSRITAFASEVG